jgi:hypothetical protein
MYSRLLSCFGVFFSEKRLLVCLACSVLLSLPGINWGVNECWNLDQMAHLKLRDDFMPAHYLKPPLHTYLNHFFVLKPVKQIMGGWFHITREHQWPVALLASRMLTLCLYCGFISAVYFSVRETCSRVAGFALSLVLATSAGILVFNRFLTADSPLLFWMAASLAFAVKGGLNNSTRDIVIAGLFAGLATADKYNGLGVAAAIPAALFCSQGWRFVIKPAAWLAALAVPCGFIVGNPGAVLDTQRFVEDFLYNYVTTPVYDGQAQGTGYLKFLACFPDIIGWPATVALFFLTLTTFGLLIRGKLTKNELLLTASALAVFGFYFVTIGKFPRMGTRFVLPAVPFAMLLAAPTLARVDWRRRLPQGLLGVILAYNIYSSIDVGLRFANDPRMAALAWVRSHVPPGARFENSYAPSWQRMAGMNLKVEMLPAATGRSALFLKMFGDKRTVQTGLNRFEEKISAETFSEEGLKLRNPEWIAFSTQVFEWSGDDRAQRFYSALDHEEIGYKKVFESHFRNRWPLAYPLRIDFIPARLVILHRSE